MPSIRIGHRHFDAAIIDARLPDMEGTDLLPKIEAASPKTVKIVITGSRAEVHKEKAERTKIDAFLLKPVKPEVILNILAEKLKTPNQMQMP